MSIVLEGKVGSGVATKVQGGWKPSELPTPELNLDAKDQSLWLVRVPAFVAKNWEKMNNNDIVGTAKLVLKQSKDKKKPPTKQLNATLDFSSIDDGEGMEHSLNIMLLPCKLFTNLFENSTAAKRLYT